MKKYLILIIPAIIYLLICLIIMITIHRIKKIYPKFKYSGYRPLSSYKLITRNLVNIDSKGRSSLTLIYILSLLKVFILLMLMNQTTIFLIPARYDTFAVIACLKAIFNILENEMHLAIINSFPKRKIISKFFASLFSILKWVALFVWVIIFAALFYKLNY